MLDKKYLRPLRHLTDKTPYLKAGIKKIWLIAIRVFRPSGQGAGFMLSEMMVAIFIFLLISGIILTILATGRNAWQIGDIRIQLQQELRKAMEAIVEELRQAGTSTVAGVPADGNPYNSITFRIPQDVVGGSIVWSTEQIQYLRGGLGGRQLLRRISTGDRVVANNIASLEFRRQAANVVNVTLRADGMTLKGTQIVINSNFQVKLRN